MAGLTGIEPATSCVTAKRFETVVPLKAIYHNKKLL